MSLSRDQILNAVDLPTEDFEVPEWGGTIHIKGVPLANERLQAFIHAPVDRGHVISAGKADRTKRPDDGSEHQDPSQVVAEMMEKALKVAASQPSEEEQRMRKMIGAVILCAIGPDGEPLFTWDDAPGLRAKNLNVVARVATRIYELAAAGQISIEEAGKG